jgi:hypothetical protein
MVLFPQWPLRDTRGFPECIARRVFRRLAFESFPNIYYRMQHGVDVPFRLVFFNMAGEAIALPSVTGAEINAMK